MACQSMLTASSISQLHNSSYNGTRAPLVMYIDDTVITTVVVSNGFNSRSARQTWHQGCAISGLRCQPAATASCANARFATAEIPAAISATHALCAARSNRHSHAYVTRRANGWIMIDEWTKNCPFSISHIGSIVGWMRTCGIHTRFSYEPLHEYYCTSLLILME